MTLDEGFDARKVQVQLADAAYFPTLGVRPLVGRSYSPAEAVPAAAPTALMSEAL